ncbi:hypothetical protein [Candidatus Electrothrix sp.]|uniref:hypothetical protein n=1 Tax=Candidatus Electrothrix sp. TaxID=2170559 RepID=UPI004057BEFC
MGRLKLPDNLDFTYKERYLSEATFVLMLIQGKGEKKDSIYAYLGIKAKVLEELCREINSNKNVDLASYGKIFCNGEGENPSKEHHSFMEESYFFNHDDINVGILIGPGGRTGGRGTNLGAQVFILDIQRIKIGVISTQSICLEDAIAIANKIHVVDTENSEMIFYKQPEDE